MTAAGYVTSIIDAVDIKTRDTSVVKEGTARTVDAKRVLVVFRNRITWC